MATSAGIPPVSRRRWQTIQLLFSKPQHLDKFLVSCFLLFTHIFQSRQRPAQRPTSGWWVSLKATGAAKASENGQPLTQGLV